MKRFQGMSRMLATPAALFVMFIGCGGEPSVASKSAAAYREAQAKGTPVAGGHDHGTPGVATATTATDHSAHATSTDPHAGHDMTAGATAVDHAAHGAGAVDHAAMGHGTAATADMHAGHGDTRGAHAGHAVQSGRTDHAAHGGAAARDHAAMGHSGASPAAHAQHGTARSTGAHAGHTTATRTGAHEQHAGMQHGTATAGTDPHAQHRQPANATSSSQAQDHSQHGATSATPAPAADPHAQHRAAATAADPHAQHRAGAAAPIAATAPRTNADIRRIQPASTLQPDAFDAPAAASVNEAAKARQSGGHEGHDMRGITPGEDRENPPAPMPATRDRTSTTSPGDHSQHGGGQATSAAEAVYACPMHPEVTSDKPGTCPKCGMALVKKD